MTSCVIIFFQQRRVIRARKCMNDGQWVTWVSVSTVSASLVSSLPVADRVVLLSSEEDKAALTPSVCAPPLSGLCWFNPGGQQPGLTAPRHRHVIYGRLWEHRADDHSDSTPAILSATHQEGDNTQTGGRLLIPEPRNRWAKSVRAVDLGSRISRDSSRDGRW